MGGSEIQQKMDGGRARSCWLLLTLSLKGEDMRGSATVTSQQQSEFRIFVLTHVFSRTGILAGDWSVHLPSGPICAVIGSSVVIPCSYDYPQVERRLSAQVIKEPLLAAD